MEAGAGVLHALLPKLAKMLTNEYHLHKGTKEGIQYIRDELESIRAALEKVSEVPPDQLDKQEKLWARKVREMSYNIEDTIDSFMVVENAGEPFGSSASCCMSSKFMRPRTYKARRDIASEIQRIRREVEEVSKRRERYQVDSIVAHAPTDPRLPALYEDEAKLVGMDQSREKIIKLLSMKDEGGSEQKLKLVSIVGPGGMGKTTLANAVYQKLQGKFDCTAFVSVSFQPNVKNILSSILRQVTSKIKDGAEVPEDKSLHRRESQKHYGNTETWSEKEIIDKIRQVLEKRRYLILIDDLWDPQPWKYIECVLIENNLGSKVITTTRNAEVANSCRGKVDGIIHELQPLSGGDSAQLFYNKIFGMDGCPSELKVVSQKILDKCEGWPLAIIAIASLLANKQTQTLDQWNSVYSSISTGLENNKGVKDMRLILSLSYRDMPSHLRACLLYLSIFPEDHIIGRDDLIRRWIAEDFLVRGRQDDTLNLYELGDKYFHDLISRSMIQPTDVDVFGRAQACTVHDLVLEFITVLSAEEDFVTILHEQQSLPPQSDSIHRLALRNSKVEHGIAQATSRMPHVRTLVVSSHAICSMPSLSLFPVVRVLELEQCTSRNVRGLESLVHLRYLRLSRQYQYHSDNCITLPKGIGKLQFLLTLDLKEARIKELPSTVVQLTQLRVLVISVHEWDKRCEDHFLRCLGNLKQLEYLYLFANKDISLDFMLRIDWAPKHLRCFTASSSSMQLENILGQRGWIFFSPLSTLPRWINSSLSILTDLSIMVKALGQADLEILADICTLRSVVLEVIEASKQKLEINGIVGGPGPATAFPCLRNLKFASSAVGLVFRPGAMQMLQKLYLCFGVGETKDVHGDFDLGLENLTSLKTVSVEMDCRSSRLLEVKAAETALHNATNLNPSCPTLVLKRHGVGELLPDQEDTPEDLHGATMKEDIPEDLHGTTMKDDALLSRVGPFGGNGGRARDIQLAPHRLESVTIRSRNVIEALAFTYSDQRGQKHSAGPWGLSCCGRDSTFHLGPSEYLMKISGTTLAGIESIDKSVISLTFVTNETSYGPFGGGRGDPFEYSVPGNSSIVGFFCRAGMSLDAIGLYVRPL